ncbi:hypothetical protein [Fundidesulfovibrio terrae]|uniref:hypothetical protein n=1 Tax=Fundidesulfovibrio terrae TaxID=2922866 RepID=UPI001FAF7682|nr:hypothetical protein [Fundidesulfovibrio terrae]
MTGERIELGGGRGKFSMPRGLLLLCVVLAMVWAYSRHFEGVADRLSRQDAVLDETGTLSADKIKLLRDASKVMHDTYGVSLRVVVRRGPVTPPPADPSVVFIGLDVAGKQAVTAIPPLLAKALPPGLAEQLANGYFDPFFAAGTWPEGLYSCVLAILEALRERN